MIYVGIIGKFFSKAGLRGLIVQSEVLAIGSVDKVLSGKMYIRAVCVYKLVYKKLYRFLINKMEDNDDVDSLKVSSSIYDMQEKVNDF